MTKVYVPYYSMTCWMQPDRDEEIKCIGVYSEKSKAIEKIIKDCELFKSSNLERNEYFKKIIRGYFESENSKLHVPERLYYGSNKFRKFFEDINDYKLPDLPKDSDDEPKDSDDKAEDSDDKAEDSDDDSIYTGEDGEEYNEDDIRKFYLHKEYFYDIDIHEMILDA